MGLPIRRLAFGFALLLALLIVPVAEACDGWGWGYQGFIYQRLPLRTGNVPAPPYFALHPPVYYSGMIVRRAYGDSPYAYHPQRPIVEPRMMPPQVAPQPRWIENPFYREVASDAQSSVSNVARVQPNPYYAAAK